MCLLDIKIHCSKNGNHYPILLLWVSSPFTTYIQKTIDEVNFISVAILLTILNFSEKNLKITVTNDVKWTHFSIFEQKIFLLKYTQNLYSTYTKCTQLLHTQPRLPHPTLRVLWFKKNAIEVKEIMYNTYG